MLKVETMRLNVSISVILFFLNVLNNTVSADSYEFRHLTTKDGLSRNSVICIFQDSRGFMWFGTEDGLNRYDGYEFKIFKASTTDNSLSHNWIWDIIEDDNKNIWIATWNGLTKYDLQTGRFTKFFPDSTKSNSISGARPSSLCLGKRNHIWIATWGGGLDCYDPVTEKFKVFHHDPNDIQSIPGEHVRYVFLDSRNRLWVGTWSGLAVTSAPYGDHVKFTRFSHKANDPSSIGSNRIKVIFEDSYGRIWIGTLGGGLNMFNENDSTFIKFINDKNDASSISSNDITAIYEDTKHRLWIGTPEDGLNLFNRDKKSFTRIRNIPDNPNSLKSNNIYSIFEDRSGLLWIGAGGINILKIHNDIFRNFKYMSEKTNSITNNNVSCFLEIKDHKVLTGTRGGGINLFDVNTGKCTPGIPHTKNCSNINALTTDNNGNIYAATAGKGLFRFIPQKRKLDHIKLIKGINNPEILRFINSMCITGNRFLWLATYDNGLIKYDTKNNSAEVFKKNGQQNGLSGNYLLSVIPGSKNDIWIGTWGGGLCHLDIKTNIFTTYNSVPDDSLSLSGNMVYSIYETQEGTRRVLWAGTDKGLSYMYPDEDTKGRFRQINTADGLPENYIAGITQDNSGNIWVSTNNGLACYSPETKQIRVFDENDNLLLNEFNPGASCKLQNGKLLFGGTEGFVMVDPGKMKPDNFRPPIVLTGFKIFNKEYDLHKPLGAVKRVILTYKQVFFSFEFAALDFTQPSKVRYFYRMKGTDTEWIDAGHRRYASYTNISPGRYTFQAKAVTRSGNASSNIISIDIIVKPPYWQSWWFRTSAILAILLILLGLHQFRIQRLLAIEKLRIRIASDLHDDIGSALTRISIISEQIQSTKDNDRIRLLSKKIGTTSREIVTTMSDIVWSIDSRNDNLTDLVDRMHDTVYKQLVTKDIKVSFKIKGFEKNKNITVDKRQNLFYIFKEAINNIVKHSGATEVSISLNNGSKQFIMIISDNGKGFEQNDIEHGNGLRNMVMRARRLKASFDISSTNGTKIVLIMKNI